MLVFPFRIISAAQTGSGSPEVTLVTRVVPDNQEPRALTLHSEQSRFGAQSRNPEY